MAERSVTATTTLTAVLGSPIRHSLSPAIHNAAFAALGLDWAMAAFEVTEADAGEAVAGLRALGLKGASVTMPLKQAVVAHLDDLDQVATRLGAVNCITRRAPNRLVGTSTDGPGLCSALAEAGVEVGGRRVVVIGAGGAARAAVLALAEAGASRVVVVARRPEQAALAAALAGGVGQIGSAAEVTEADVVVNATPVGMDQGRDGARGPDLPPRRAFPVDPELLGPGQVAFDMIYEPAPTAWLVEAGRRGARTLDGVSMLVHQAALAFEQWSGQPAPLAVMHEAARRALRARRGGASQ